MIKTKTNKTDDKIKYSYALYTTHKQTTHDYDTIIITQGLVIYTFLDNLKTNPNIVFKHTYDSKGNIVYNDYNVLTLEDYVSEFKGERSIKIYDNEIRAIYDIGINMDSPDYEVVYSLIIKGLIPEIDYGLTDYENSVKNMLELATIIHYDIVDGAPELFI